MTTTPSQPEELCKLIRDHGEMDVSLGGISGRFEIMGIQKGLSTVWVCLKPLTDIELLVNHFRKLARYDIQVVRRYREHYELKVGGNQTAEFYLPDDSGYVPGGVAYALRNHLLQVSRLELLLRGG